MVIGNTVLPKYGNMEKFSKAWFKGSLNALILHCTGAQTSLAYITNTSTINYF